MAKKKLRKKLDKLIGESHEQGSIRKRVKKTDKLLELLEQEKLKYQGRLAVQQNDTDTEKYNRKLNLINLYLAKGNTYRETLISEITLNSSEA
ncbi:MAG: hypothetical protein GY726_01160 [Proteobacteria bacterium]|nr:hypothetical protein [Pseudomonadota bacterium]